MDSTTTKTLPKRSTSRFFTKAPARHARNASGGSSVKSSQKRLLQEYRKTTENDASELFRLQSEVDRMRIENSRHNEIIEGLQVEVAVAQSEAADAFEECARQASEADKEIALANNLLKECQEREAPRRRVVTEQRKVIDQLKSEVLYYKEEHKSLTATCSEARQHQTKLNKAIFAWDLREARVRHQVDTMRKENDELSYKLEVSRDHEEVLADVLRISLKEVSKLRQEIATRDLQERIRLSKEDDESTLCGSPRPRCSK